MLNKKQILTLSIAAILVLAVTLVLKTGLTSKVSTVTVAIDTAVDAVPAIINVRSDYTFTLSSEESGRVENSQLILGGHIEKNAKVLQIEQTDLQLDARILKAEIENLQARLALKSAEEAELRKRQEIQEGGGT